MKATTHQDALAIDSGSVANQSSLAIVATLPHRGLAGVPILLVDDDARSTEPLAIFLRTEGGDVEVAGTAEAATAILETFWPRVILLDLVLPSMSGLLLAQLLKAEASTRDIILIAVTTFAGPDTERIARDVGCAAYLSKPIDPRVLVDVVLAQLGGR